MTLTELRQAAHVAKGAFDNSIATRYPGMGEYHWHRALSAIRGENVRRNDDQSRDQELADDAELQSLWDDYIKKLHAFYRARDGERGVLGGRGL